MSQLASAAKWLASTMAEHNSSASNDEYDVYYVRGNRSILIAATPGDQDYEVFNTDGQLTTFRSTDWKVNRDELEIDGELFDPDDEDHLLQEFTDGRKQLFAVVKPDRENAFQWCDHHQVRIRIHTQREAAR